MEKGPYSLGLAQGSKARFMGWGLGVPHLAHKSRNKAPAVEKLPTP